MNERERAEFERHKAKAEEQLNQMYYANGKSNGKSTSANKSLTMPSFLEPPKPNPNNSKTQNSNVKKPDLSKKENSAKKENAPPQNQSSKKNNILNLLNFKGIKMDNDRLIILAICLLLTGEEADELLILALIYIML